MSVGVLESFVLPALSGSCIGIIGIAYRLGQSRGLSPLDVLGTCCVLGTAIFGTAFVRSGGQIAEIPLSLWAWGIAAGLGQYAAVKLFGAALRTGPLAPAWCVVSLNFVPTMVYAALFLSETLRPVQYGAVLASVLCVVAASIKPDAADARREPRGGGLGKQGLYLAILATIFVVGSLLSIAIRAIGAQKAVLGEAFGQHSYFLLLQCYVVLLICTFVDMWAGGRLAKLSVSLAAVGALAGAGSVGGLALLTCCATSGMAFAIAGIAQILFVAVVSVVGFGEKPTANWYGTIVLGVLAVTLANWGQVGG